LIVDSVHSKCPGGREILRAIVYQDRFPRPGL
jgi:hypothetical protein